MLFPGIKNISKFTFHLCQTEMRSLLLNQHLCTSVPQAISTIYNPNSTSFLWPLLLRRGPSCHNTIPAQIIWTNEILGNFLRKILKKLQRKDSIACVRIPGPKFWIIFEKRVWAWLLNETGTDHLLLVMSTGTCYPNSLFISSAQKCD